MQDAAKAYNLEANDWKTSSLSVVVLGASGDLAKKKILPALFALYYEGLMPEVRGGGPPLPGDQPLARVAQWVALPASADLLRLRASIVPVPQNFQVFGYARSKMTDDEFRELISNTLTCRIDAR